MPPDSRSTPRFSMFRLIILMTALSCCSSFVAHSFQLQALGRHGSSRTSSIPSRCTHALDMSSTPASPPPYEPLSQPLDRREFVEIIPPSLALGALGTIALAAPKEASAAALGSLPKAAPVGTKVVVLGGNGFVGSKVCEMLHNAGAQVVSVSRSGSKPVKWAPGESWVDQVSWEAGDPTKADISPIFSKATAVISCVGVIGGSDEEMERGNGDVNVAAASQAAKANVERFVYVSISRLVPEAFGGLALKGYFEGKKRAEEAVASSFPSSGFLIKPTFIYGGDAFELTPPRVSDGYGSAIDALLSSGPIRAISGISPGLIKVALSPPVSRDNVALACVAGALGRLDRTSFDGADEINAAARRA